MYSATAPLELGDIFDRLFRLTGKTISRTAIVALIFLGPTSLIYAFGLNQFFSGIAEFTEQAGVDNHPDIHSFAPMLVRILIFAGSIIIHYIAYFAVMIAVVTIVGAELDGQPIGWRDALQNGFGGKILRVFGQILLQMFALTGIFCVSFIMILMGKISGWFIFFGVIAILGAIPYGIYLAIQWAFTTPAIACEDAGVFESFDRSSSLVRGDWWRVFGILFLLTLIIQFAVSIICTPINLIAMWGFFSKYLHFIFSMKSGKPDPHAAVDMLRSMGFGVGIATSISSALTALVLPILTTVMYYDLRFRKHEISAPAPIEPASTAG